jgi:two-component system, cell cycle sensor histidine kinase and response regulator CckA
VTIATSNLDADAAFSGEHPTVPVGRYVVLTVRDSGTGMDPQTQSHIFEPFFTTKPRGSGAGLGLATVYSIVNQSGGYITAYSEWGVGSTFSVYLPRVEVPAAQDSSEHADVTATGTETVLLVEDQHPVRELARRFLEIAGYKVLEAPSGPDALRISREHEGHIDLMVTDVVMPRMSGRELALQLASERPEMKMLYMSGHTEEAIVHHGVLKEGVEFLQKPFTQRDLTERVRQILDSQQSPAEGTDRAEGESQASQ